MRTTINIEDDLLLATKKLACKEPVAGKVVSRLLRIALSGVGSETTAQNGPIAKSKAGGFRPFVSADSRIVTNDEVNQLREMWW